MAKIKPKKKKLHKAMRRNAAPAAAPARGPRRRMIRRAPPPDFSTTIASVVGGGGGALLGGILANQEILSPEAVGLAMGIGGAVGAYTLEGSARVAANGVAAAGAGQLALAMLQKRVKPPVAPEAVAAAPAPATPAALPAPASPGARQGWSRSRVLSNFQSVAPEVATRLGYVDDLDGDDGYDDALDAAYAA